MEKQPLLSAEATTDTPPAEAVSAEDSKPQATNQDSDIELPFTPPKNAGDLGQFGKYRICKELGRGGMGLVFLAIDEKLERKIALKIMRPEQVDNVIAKERFLREARAAAKVRSEHVVVIHEADEINQVPYIALEFLEGVPLDEYLKQYRQLPISEILRIGREAALGLAAAHEWRLVHRDIKPSNLWLESPNGRVKLLDFGLAKPIDHVDAEITNAGSVLGTPAYMSPEQGLGEQVDGRTDLFSLGCVLYRLCTGVIPFSRPTLMGLLNAIAREEPVPIREYNSDVPNALVELITRMMAKKPDNRPASAEAVVEELDHLIVAQGEEDYPTKTLPLAIHHKPRRINSWRIIPFFLTALLLVAAGIIIIKITNKDGSTTELKIHDPAKIEISGNTITVEPQTTKSPDRKAADYVLSVGGTVSINDEAKTIELAADLPTQDFRLTGFDLNNNTRVNDAGLAHFKGCQHLTSIKLYQTNITDAGLKHFDGCSKVNYLFLNNTSIGDAGLKNFSQCKNIEYFSVAMTKITDRGLEPFKGCTQVKYLYLHKTAVTNEGLSYFANCRQLSSLFILDTNITDQGLEPFREVTELQEIHANNTAISDQGLANFSRSKNIRYLSLANTRVTDQGLVHLQGCASLQFLYLYGTLIGDQGLANFKACTNLKDVQLNATLITDQGLAYLKNSVTGIEKLVLSNTAITDHGLAEFRGCESITSLHLTHTRITNQGLANFQKCKHITELYLYNTLIGDEGLANFADCNEIQVLQLNRTLTSDQGIAHFRNCKDLRIVNLANTRVTNAGLAHLAGCRKLTDLYLWNLNIDNAGLEHFRDCKELTALWLNGTQITNEGLATFTKCTAIQNLNLSCTSISDAGLEYFANCRNITQLSLTNTRVRRSTYNEFIAIRPNCSGNWSFIDTKRQIDPDRRAAEYVSAIGGTTSVNGQMSTIKLIKDLPSEHFQLTTAILRGNFNLRDTGLVYFTDCKNLRNLDLYSTNLTDAGLRNLEASKKLVFLSLQNTFTTDVGLSFFIGCDDLESLVLGDWISSVTDRGLQNFKNCKKLKMLSLQNIKITDEGLKLFQDCHQLRTLWLNGTKVTDNGLDYFKGCRGLEDLNLQNTQIGDRGIEHLKACTQLTQINVRQTQVPPAKVQELARLYPKCQILWNGGIIGPKP